MKIPNKRRRRKREDSPHVQHLESVNVIRHSALKMRARGILARLQRASILSNAYQMFHVRATFFEPLRAAKGNFQTAS
ncbi:MAG: hypothetical protein AUG51_16305 [Acidobacteria bacterium 13_1_20CM_3_53_8]|nr:MAG: hypothetical protein AUG51_16305 [Acidobacteria bacterium 13_1_20CM_3_53_8]